QVGIGLPTSGSQTLTELNTDASSTSSLVFFDLDPTIPGVDVVYTAASAPADSIRKYVKQPDGTWVNRGAYTFGGVDHVAVAVNADGSASIYAAGPGGVITFSDPAPLTATIAGDAGTFPNYLIAPPAGYTIGGIDFSPIGNTICYPNCDQS